ncbi:Differentially expressed in FDCP 6 [Homalodisca vitripennis]|nr:Differentially expressed in FDCP 6 [Homalodisca vitripennis]
MSADFFYFNLCLMWTTLSSSTGSRLQWLSALQLAISQSGGSVSYQRQQALRRKAQREVESEERRRRSSLIQDMGAQLQAEKMARVAAELQFREVKIEKEKQLEQLEALLEEETQAKKDEEIVRNLQARVLREEWEKREELERLQEEQRLLLEQEREKRIEFEMRQREKEAQLQVWLLLGQVTAERSCPCKRPTRPLVVVRKSPLSRWSPG